MNLYFTLGSSTNPSITNASNLITKLYKQAYQVIGQTYAAYSASAEHSIIDTETTKDLIIAEAEVILSEWAKALQPNSTTKMPKQQLSSEARQQLGLLALAITHNTSTKSFPIEDSEE